MDRQASRQKEKLMGTQGDRKTYRHTVERERERLKTENTQSTYVYTNDRQSHRMS